MESRFMDSLILNALKGATTVGITAKQIVLKTGYDEEAVAKRLEDLHKESKVDCIGRGLWLLKPYVEVSNDPYFTTPEQYKRLFYEGEGIKLSRYTGKITFSENGDKKIHRWSPYVQGFSSSFTEGILTKYKVGKGKRVLDPFVGSGTVLVCARMMGAESIGVDLMPLMTFMARVKTRWEIDVEQILRELNRIESMWREPVKISPPFLKNTGKQFDKEVLEDLLRLKQSIQSVDNVDVRELFQLALASILVGCSRLKRSPCLAYVRDKQVPKSPFNLFKEKVKGMVEDLKDVQKYRDSWGPEPEIWEMDTKDAKYQPESIDLAITSPPYVNGMDYVINYKIEMTWLDQVHSYDDLSALKNRMVACDNLSRKVTKEFAEQKPKFQDDWLDKVVEGVKTKVSQKGSYRRDDMHLIVGKYFDDIYPILQNVYDGLTPNGRFVIVVGDSLIAGTYIPADLIIARMGKTVGFQIESVEIARKRRSGQRRSFVLRESVVTLAKGPVKKQQGPLEVFIHES